MTIRYSGKSDKINIYMTPMPFGIIEEYYTSQKSDLEDANVIEWKDLFEKSKKYCMEFAGTIRSAVIPRTPFPFH